MSSSVHIDNKRKDILILGKVITQGLISSTLAAEALYSINFTRPGIKFCLGLHYNGTTVSYVVMLRKYISSKQKTLK